MTTSPTPATMQTLLRVCDAILPEGDSSWRATVPERAARILDDLPDPRHRWSLLILLRALESPAAMMGLTGRAVPFSRLDRQGRIGALRAMSRHPLAQVRGGFASLKRMSALAYYADAGVDERNPTWASLGYPGPIAQAPSGTKPIAPIVLPAGVTDCEVVVVGSGAGGGMVAAELAEAGHDVLVLEAGDYLSEPDYAQLEMAAVRSLYLDKGLSLTVDGGTVLLAGGCLGGGTVVNFTTSFRTPDDVRDEWCREAGTRIFQSREFDRSLDAAWDRLCVNLDHNIPSSRDAIMRRGLDALGWHVAAMPRDVEGCTQDDTCGYCGFGCVRGAKRSSTRTTLQAAFDAGARIAVRSPVDRVVVERGRATGVLGRTLDGSPFQVRARVAVIAAGALRTPGILLRSGLDGAVGLFLRLHPITGVWGRFEEEVRPWTGTLQALYSAQHADLHEGYGVRLETAPVHPGLMALAAPWDGPTSLEAAASALVRSSAIGILLRDRGWGRVTVRRDGRPRVHYRLGRYDRRHMRFGVEGAARVMAAAGATEVSSTHLAPLSYKPAEEPIDRWLHRVRHAGFGPHRALYVSFHQMGSCRMGTDRRTSVVDPSGESHLVRGMYVADGSLFPTASGVNPMLTIAALAHLVAQGLKASL